MTFTLVKGNTSPASLLFKKSLTLDLAHYIAFAFTDGALEIETHFRLSEIYGHHRFRWYVIDCSSDIWIITFSNVANPRVLSYRGQTARISSQDAGSLTLTLEDIESYQLGKLPDLPVKTYYMGES